MIFCRMLLAGRNDDHTVVLGAMQVRAQDTPLVILRVAQRGGASLQAAWTFLRTCGTLATLLLGMHACVDACPTGLTLQDRPRCNWRGWTLAL